MSISSSHIRDASRWARVFAIFFLLTASELLQAEARLELEETRITGAQELPKVLYIVPWKKTPPGIRPLPMRSLLEEELAPLEMDVFRREGRYYDFIRSGEQVAK